MRMFVKIVASPARGENRICSHICSSDSMATTEKIAKNNHETFSVSLILRDKITNSVTRVATICVPVRQQFSKNRITIESKRSRRVGTHPNPFCINRVVWGIREKELSNFSLRNGLFIVLCRAHRLPYQALSKTDVLLHYIVLRPLTVTSSMLGFYCNWIELI